MSEVTSPELRALNQRLDALTLVKNFQMTQANYHVLMSIKNRLRDLPDQEGVELDAEDEDYRQYLVQCAYRWLNEMEAYYERHGNKWAEPTA